MDRDDFLALTLPERIAWLHSQDGPRGKLSHDKFGAILGTSRQTVIGWETAGGQEPQQKYRDALAEFSGFPAAAFSRREAEVLAAPSTGHRLRDLEDAMNELGADLREELGALARRVLALERQDPPGTAEGAM